MHRIVHVECFGESYFCFILFEIVKYVYDCAEEICSAYVAESIQNSCMSCEYAEG